MFPFGAKTCLVEQRPAYYKCSGEAAPDINISTSNIQAALGHFQPLLSPFLALQLHKLCAF